MGLADLVIYIVLIILLFLAIAIEAKHYVCDTGHCSVLEWSKERSNNDREKYVNLLRYTGSYSAWMKAYIAAFLITLVAFWFFTGGLPPVIHFILFFLFVFFIIYFMYVFYQHHFLRPVNADLESYIMAACTTDDPRLAKVHSPIWSPIEDENYEYPYTPYPMSVKDESVYEFVSPSEGTPEITVGRLRSVEMALGHKN